MLPRSGTDAGTRKLLSLEQRLFDEEDTDSYGRTREEIRRRVLATSFVRTSSELDEFLQLAMLYVVTLLPYKAEDGKALTYKVGLAIHSPRHDVLLVKPSFYYRGRCAALHPTTSLSRESLSSARPIGQTGLSFLSNRPILCTRFDDSNPCPQYIHLRSHNSLRTTASLCIPLTATMDRTLARLAEASDACNSCSENCDVSLRVADLVAVVGQAAPDSDQPSAVLDVEFHEAALPLSRRLQFVRDPSVSKVLGHVHRTLIQHQRERDRYWTLKACTSLFDLAHHNFSARGAYELLLRQVSMICGGADVTLHVRDLEMKDQDRCIRLVVPCGRFTEGAGKGRRRQDK